MRSMALRVAVRMLVDTGIIGGLVVMLCAPRFMGPLYRDAQRMQAGECQELSRYAGSRSRRRAVLDVTCTSRAKSGHGLAAGWCKASRHSGYGVAGMMRAISPHPPSSMRIPQCGMHATHWLPVSAAMTRHTVLHKSNTQPGLLDMLRGRNNLPCVAYYEACVVYYARGPGPPGMVRRVRYPNTPTRGKLGTFVPNGVAPGLELDRHHGLFRPASGQTTTVKAYST